MRKYDRKGKQVDLNERNVSKGLPLHHFFGYIFGPRVFQLIGLFGLLKFQPNEFSLMIYFGNKIGPKTPKVTHRKNKPGVTA